MLLYFVKFTGNISEVGGVSVHSISTHDILIFWSLWVEHTSHIMEAGLTEKPSKCLTAKHFFGSQSWYWIEKA